MDNIVTNVNTERSICKGLRLLLIVQIIGLTYNMLSNVVSFGNWYEWLNLAISAGVLFCLIALRREHRLYSVAAVTSSLQFIYKLLMTILWNSPVFPFIRDLTEDALMLMYYMSLLQSIAFPILGMLAMLFEYLAHYKIAKATSQRLSRGWLCLTVVAVILSMVMWILTQVLTAMLRQDTLNIHFYQQIYPVLNIPGRLAKIAYIVLLFQTERMLCYAQPDRGGML